MKKWLAVCRYVVPDELEEALENYSRDGFHLTALGEMSFFYYEFLHTEPKKYRYVVDFTTLPKALYLRTILEKGWEYLGKTGNCYVWRMEYQDRRPEDFADKESRKKHCHRLGIAAILALLLCAGGALALFYGAYMEIKLGFHRYYLSYIIEAVLMIPFAVYFGWAAKKLLKK